MSSQLREVLNRFSEQSGPLSLNQMAREMRIDVGLLHGMIDYWVRKGKLREVNGAAACKACGGQTACPFVINMPRYFELATEDADAPPCIQGPACRSS